MIYAVGAGSTEQLIKVRLDLVDEPTTVGRVTFKAMASPRGRENLMEKLSKSLWHIGGAILLIAVAISVVGKTTIIVGGIVAAAIWVYREERKHARTHKVPAKRSEEVLTETA
jgi:hypothetical protein